MNSVLSKCKIGFPVTAIATATPGTDYTVNTLTINTKNFVDPCIKFEFASNIIATPSTDVEGADLTLNFQMYRLCKGETTRTALGPVWTFVRTAGTDPTSDTFTFIVCDCDCDCNCVLHSCCTYTVVVAAVGAGTGVINNPTISALVVEKSYRC